MKILFSFFFCLVFVNAHSQSLYFPPKDNSNWDTIQPSSLGWCVDTVDSLYAYLENTNTDAFIILKDGKIVLEKYFGSFNQSSTHYWASAGKSLTAMMIGIAQQKGLLNINTSVSTYLGTGWTNAPVAKENAIKVRHLLTMTSGLNDAPNLPCTNEDDAASCLQYLADTSTRWSYHTGAYRKLEDIITTVSNQNYSVVTKNYIGNKIGMNGLWLNSVFYSTARDMAKFGLLTLNKGIWEQDTVLNDSNYFNAMTNTSQNYNKAYGYLWWLNGKSAFMLPQSQLVFPFTFIPSAPADMFCALGKNDQKIYIVPSQNMVVIRMGESAYNSLAWSPYDTILWHYIKELGNGCTVTNIQTKKSNENLKLFPNPANNFISFNGFSNSSVIQYSIINLFGQLVKQDITYNHSIDISDLPSGQYILSLEDDEQQTSKQFIKK